jgi:hypothetical protein
LFVITLGLRHDDATWREFPRLLPHENPSRWEYMRFWVNGSVTQKRYREVTDALDLEKFFAEGPAWVRAQLLARRALAPNGQPANVADWQRLLVMTGAKSVEALAAVGQEDAALRLAAAVVQVDSATGTRAMLANVMTRNGVKPERVKRFTETLYGR